MPVIKPSLTTRSWRFVAKAAGCERGEIIVFFDSRAGAITISGDFASRVLRKQKRMRAPGVQVLALCDLGRYPAPQHFGGFLSTELSKGVDVNIAGDLSLEVDGGKVLLTLRTRIGVEQEEDLLISAGVMHAWQVTPEPKVFTCHRLGVQIPRIQWRL